MAETPTTAGLAEAAGISKSYASEIVNGVRKPSRSLAIHIFRRTAWKHAAIETLTEAQIAVFEQVEPWSPRVTTPEQQAAA